MAKGNCQGFIRQHRSFPARISSQKAAFTSKMALQLQRSGLARPAARQVHYVCQSHSLIAAFGRAIGTHTKPVSPSFCEQVANRSVVVRATAGRPLWLPGADVPAHLDGRCVAAGHTAGMGTVL